MRPAFVIQGFCWVYSLCWRWLTAINMLTKDDVSPVRAATGKMLASDPDPRSSEALAGATADKSWIVRAAALDAIAQRGDPTLVDKIYMALNDQKDIVRFTAAVTIARLTSLPKPGSTKSQ